MGIRSKKLLAFLLSFLMATSPLTPMGEVLTAYADDTSTVVTQQTKQEKADEQPAQSSSESAAQATTEEAKAAEAESTAPDQNAGTSTGQSPGTEQAAEEAAKQAAEEAAKQAADEQTNTQNKTATEPAMPAFQSSVELPEDGIVVYVDAEEGTFPAGVRLDVRKVQLSDEQTEAVDNATPEDQNVAKRYSFDVKVLDAAGNEIQPAEGKTVNVRFATPEAGDQNLQAAVYHHDAADQRKVEEVKATEEKRDQTDVVSVEAASFSYYTVEFTYDDLQYVLEGNGSVPLADILAKVGLVGEVSAASSDAPELFSVEQRDGVWTVTALKAFTTTQKLTVVIAGVSYEIEVTDQQEAVASVQVGNETTNYSSLQDALGAASTAGADATVTLLCDINLEQAAWNSVYLNGYNGSARTVVVNGNEKAITGLAAPLFLGTWSNTKIEIYNLTVKDSRIAGVYSDGCGGNVSSAFVGCVSASKGTVIKDCNVMNCSFSGGKYTAAFIGYASGYSRQDDGPVVSDVTIEGCKASGNTFTSSGSVGALMGHASGDAWTVVTISKTEATDNSITGPEIEKTGILIGTSGAGQMKDGQQGGVWVEATESNNQLFVGDGQLEGNNVHEIGRIGTSGGQVTFTEGGSYTVNPLDTSDPTTGTIAAAEGFESAQVDGTWTIRPLPPVAKIGDTEYLELTDALSAAQTGDTVEVLADTVEFPSINKSDITIKTTTGTKVTKFGGLPEASKNVTIDGFEFTTSINPMGENFVIQNCTFTGENAVRWAYAHGDVYFKNCSFQQTDRYGIHFDGNVGSVHVEGGSITGSVAIAGSVGVISFDGVRFAGRSSVSKHCNINIYGKATFTECGFSQDYTNGSSRGILMLGDNNSALVTMTNCTVDEGDGALTDIFRRDYVQGVGAIDPAVSEGGKYTGGDFVANADALRAKLETGYAAILKDDSDAALFSVGKIVPVAEPYNSVENSQTFKVSLVSDDGTESVDLSKVPVSGTSDTGNLELGDINSGEVAKSVGTVLAESGNPDDVERIVIEVRDANGQQLAAPAVVEEGGVKRATIDAKAWAIAYDESDNTLGKTTVSNEAINNARFTFRLPVSSDLASEGEVIEVVHKYEEDGQQKSDSGMYTVKKATDNSLYVDVTVTHFSTFEEIKAANPNAQAYNSTKALTYDTLAGAFSAASENDTIVLLRDVTVADTLVVTDKKVTFDLYGNKLTANGGFGVARDKDDAELTLVSTNGTTTGVIECSDPDSYAAYVYKSTLKIADKNVKIAGAIGENNGVVQLSAGTYTKSPDASYVTPKHEVVKTGDVWVVTDTYDITYMNGDAAYAGSLTPTTYNTLEGASLPTDAPLENHQFRGWYPSATSTSAVTAISVGTTGDQTFYGKWQPYVAKVGTTNYDRFADAAAAAVASDATVVMLAEPADGDTYELRVESGSVESETLVVDWGTTVTPKDVVTAPEGFAVTQTTSGSTRTYTAKKQPVSITHDGSKTYKDSLKAALEDESLADGDVVTVERDQYIGNDDATISHSVTLAGGKLNFGIGSAQWTVADGKTLTVDPDFTSEGAIFNAVKGAGDTSKLIYNGGTYTWSTSNNIWTLDNAVAQVKKADGSLAFQYASLSAAVEAAEQGQTVELLQNSTETKTVTIDKALTVDLGTHTLTSAKNPVIKVTSDVGADGTTIKNGKVEYTGTVAWANAILVDGRAKLEGLEASGQILVIITVERNGNLIIEDDGTHIFGDISNNGGFARIAAGYYGKDPSSLVSGAYVVEQSATVAGAPFHVVGAAVTVTHGGVVTGYGSIQAAVDAIGRGTDADHYAVGTIQLMRDIELTQPVHVPNTGSDPANAYVDITIDGGTAKHKIYGQFSDSFNQFFTGFGTNALREHTGLTFNDVAFENTNTNPGSNYVKGFVVVTEGQGTPSNDLNLTFTGCTFKNFHTPAYVNPAKEGVAYENRTLTITNCAYDDVNYAYTVDTSCGYVSGDWDGSGALNVQDQIAVTLTGSTGYTAEREVFENVRVGDLVYTTFAKAAADAAASAKLVTFVPGKTIAEGDAFTLPVGQTLKVDGDGTNVRVLPAAGYEDCLETNTVTVEGKTTTTYSYSTTVASITRTAGGQEVTTYYVTLADAIAAAQSGDTVKLLSNFDTVRVRQEADKSIVLDLGGMVLTGRLSFFAGAVEVKNGTLKGRLDAYDASNVTVATDATVDGAVVVWGDGTYGQAGCKTPTLNVNGTVQRSANAFDGLQGLTGDEGTYAIVTTNGTDTSKPVINVNDGAVINGGTDQVGIYLPSGALAVSGGQISGSTAVYFKSTDLAISGGTLTGKGAAAEYNYNGNGGDATGEALVIDSCNYPNGVGTVSVSGGTFTSVNASAVGSYNSQGGALKTEFVSGGIFSSQVPYEYCADGKMPSQKSTTTNMYTVVDGTPKLMIAATAQHDAAYFAVGTTENVANHVYTSDYNALNAAISDAAEGDSIVLLANLDLGSNKVAITKGVTIDGTNAPNNWKITSAAGNVFEINTTQKFTAKNLSINATNTNYASNAFRLLEVTSFDLEFDNVDGEVGARFFSSAGGHTAGGTLTANDCDITRIGFTPSTPYRNEWTRGIGFWGVTGGTLNINGGKFEGFDYCVIVNGTGTQNTVNVEGTTLSGRTGVYGAGTTYTTFTVKDCTVNGYNTSKGVTEGFACIVDDYPNTGTNNNDYYIIGGTYNANVSSDFTLADNASEYFLDIRGTNSRAFVSGEPTYTNNNPARGGLERNIDIGEETSASIYLTNSAITSLSTEQYDGKTIFDRSGITVIPDPDEQYKDVYQKKIQVGTVVAEANTGVSGAGTQRFYSVQEAIDYACQSGSEDDRSVTLVANATENVTIPENTKLKLTTSAILTAKDSGPAVTVKSGADLSIEPLLATGTSSNGIRATGSANAIKVESGGNLVVSYYTVQAEANAIETEGYVTVGEKAMVKSTGANGAGINGTSTSNVDVNGGTVTGGYAGITTDSGEVGILDGTVLVESTGYYAIRANGASTVYVCGGTVGSEGCYGAIRAADTTKVYVDDDDSNNASAAHVLGNDYGIVVMGQAQLQVVDGTIESTHAYDANYADGNAISANGSNTNPTASTTIIGGTIKSNNVAIYNPAGDLAIIGGTITGATGVYTKSGALSMPKTLTYTDMSGTESSVAQNTAVINGVGTATEYRYYGDGCYATGDAVVIDSCGYPNGSPTAAIQGGTLTSTDAKAVASYAYGKDGDVDRKPLTSFVSGGSFSSQVPLEYCAENYMPTGKVGDYYGVKQGSAVCYIEQTGEYYASLREAVNTATANQTIMLVADDYSLQNFSGTGTYDGEIEINKPITITGPVDAEGKPVYTIYGKNDLDISSKFNDLFISSSEGTVTVSNLKFDSFSNAVNSAMSKSPILVGSQNHKVVLENLQFTKFNCEAIHINGGEFDVANCYIDCTKTTGTVYTKGIQITNAATGSISNTTIVNVTGTSDTGTAGIEAIGSGSVSISGCTIVSASPYGEGIWASTAEEEQFGSSQVTVTDCIIEAAIALHNDSDKGAVLNVTSGKYMGEVESTEDTGISITGGVFSADIPEEYCGTSGTIQYVPIPNTDAATKDQYPVTVGDKSQTVCHIVNGLYYASLIDAIAASGNNDVIQLDTNVETSAYISITKDVIIDLNGHTVTRTGTGSCVFSPEKAQGATTAGSLTVRDTSAGATGKVIGGVPIWLEDGGSFTLESGTIEAVAMEGVTGSGTNAIYSDGNNSININGGALKTTVDDSYTIALLNGGSTLNITGGTVTAEGSNSTAIGDNGSNATNTVINISQADASIPTLISASKDVAIYKPGRGTLNVSGGTITGTTAIYQKGGTLNVTGGTITATGDKVAFEHSGNGCKATGDAIVVESCAYPAGEPALSISGSPNIRVKQSAGTDAIGYFEWAQEGETPKPGSVVSTSNAIDVTDGYMWVKQSDNTYKLGEVVATITKGGATTPYESLAAAVAAADDNDTIVLVKDEVVDPMLNVTKSVAIDLNGKTLSGAHEESAVSTQKIFEVTGGVTLTINGAAVEGGHGVGTFQGRINVGKAGNDNGNVVLNGGIYECGQGQTVLHVNGECRDSDVTISGATISSPDDNGIQLNGAGTFTIENSNISGKTAVYQKAGQLTVTGSTLTSTATGHTPYNFNGNGSNATGDALVVDTCAYPGGAPTAILGAGNTITVQPNSGNVQVGYYEYNTTAQGYAPADIKATSKDMTVPEGYFWKKVAEGYVLTTTIALTSVEVAGEYTYNGSEITPNLVVKAGDEVVPATSGEGSDVKVNYTVEYKQANEVATVKNAGEYTVVVTGQGDYKESVQTTFTVAPKSIRDASVSAYIASQAYTGSALTPVPQVVDDAIQVGEGEQVSSKALTSDDFDVAYDGRAEVGTATATITGKGNYTDKRTVKYDIVANTQTIANAPVILKQDDIEITDETYTYDGTAKTPTVTITGLTENTDFKVTFYNNVEAGKALAYVEGIGGYVGGTVKEFTINKANVVKPTAKANLTYTGSEQGGVAEDEAAKANYTLTGTVKATEAGTYSAVATLNDANHQWADGTTKPVEVTWTIGQATVADLSINAIPDQVHTGAAIEPELTFVSMPQGAEYDVTWTNNTNVGQASVTVTLKGDYTGTATQNFNIVSAVARIGNTTFASLPAAFAAAQANDTIELLADVELAEMLHVTKGKVVALDLKGHTVKAAEGSSWTEGDMLINVDYGANLTVSDSSPNLTGLIDATTNGKPDGKLYGAIKMTQYGGKKSDGDAVLTVNGGTIKGTNYGISGNGNRAGTSVTINGGIVAAEGNDPTEGNNAIYQPQDGTLTINGGTLVGRTAVYAKAGYVIINGGKLIGNGTAADYGYYGNGGQSTGDALVIDNCNYPTGTPTATINGGEFAATNGGKQIGSYAGNTATALADVTAMTDALTTPDDEMWVEDGSGYKLVKAHTVTFKANASDIDAYATQKVADGQKVTAPETDPTAANKVFKEWQLNGAAYDFNTQTVTGDLTLVAAWFTKVEVPTPNANVYNGQAKTGVATDDVNYDVVEAEGYTNTATNVGTYKVKVQPKSGYVWTDGTADAKDVEWTIAKQLVTIPTAHQSPITYDGAEHHVLTVAETDPFKVMGKNTVTDAGDYMAFAVLKDSANYAWSDLTTDMKPYEFTVNPKALTDAMVSDIAPGFEAEPEVSVIDGGKALVKGTDYDVTYNNNTATVTGKGNYTGTVTKTFTVGTAVAQIGETKYADLATAVASAKTGETIVLLDDIALTTTVVTADKNFTIDLNGHDIAATDARALWVKSGEVNIAGEGTISATASENSEFPDSSSVIRVGDTTQSAAAKLTVGKDVTVSSDHCYGITVFGKNAAANELVVNGKVVVTGTASAISGNGNTGNAAANITVNNGAEVSATTDAGIYFPSAGTLDINGGTVTGPTAVYAKAGTININGGTLAGTGSKADYTFNGNGLNATGDAFVADNCNYPAGTNGPVVTLGNAMLTSANANQVGSYYGNTKEDLSVVTSTNTDALTIADNQMWVADGSNYKLVEAVTVTLKDGESTVETQKIAKGEKATMPADPTKDGFAFVGWFAEGATEEFDFETAITSDTTLAAKWNEKVAAPTAKTGLTYNGAEQTGVEAADGYTLSGNTGTEAKSYTATATLKEGYIWADETTGAKTVEWTIAKADLSFATIDAIAPQTYTGSAIEVAPVVRLNGRNVAASEYDVSYLDGETATNVNVGTAKVTISAKENGNYTGSTKTYFAINKAEADQISVDIYPEDVTYNGSEQTPEVKVTVGEGQDEKILDPRSDYTLVYYNNVNAGTATVVVTLKGNYDGTATGTFVIAKANVARPGAACKTYNGAEQGVQLTNTQEQASLYRLFGDVKATDAGDYKVIAALKDVNNYQWAAIGEGNPTSDDIEIDWSITPKSATVEEITIDQIDQQSFDGEFVEPTLTVKDGEKVLEAGKDYEVEYENNDGPTTEQAPAIAKAEFKGNYEGTKTENFQIVNAEYAITFVNEDGSELQKDENVEYGTMPTKPADPTKAPEGNKTYKFEGWTPEVVGATADATYTATYTEVSNVAKVGETYYPTFEAAIAGVPTDGTPTTIELLDDVELTQMLDIAQGKDVTLDLAGHAIKAAKGNEWTDGDMLICVNHGGKLTVDDSSDDKAGTIDATTNGMPAGKLYGAIKMTKAGGDNSKAAEFVLNNGTVKGTNYGISGNGNPGRNNTSVTINGGSVIATGNAAEAEGNAIYQPQNGKLTVNGGTLEGWTAVYAKAGNVNVNGGELKANGQATEYTDYRNGGKSTGDALVIDNCNYPTAGSNTPTAIIKGGTFASENGKQIGSYANNYAVTLAPVTATTDDISVPDSELWVADGDGYKLVKAYTVTFKANESDEEPFATQKVGDGQTATAPETGPTAADKVFKEWQFKDTDGSYKTYTFQNAVTGDLTLVAAWLTKVTVPTAEPGLTYDGQAKSGIEVPENAGFKIVEEQGFTNSETNAGTYKVKVSLTDSANTVWDDGTTEARDIEWVIAPADLSAAYIEPIGNQTYGTAGWNEPAVTVKDAAGNELKGATVEYKNNNGVGLATVTVTPGESTNYTGKATTQFAINPAGSADVTIEPVDEKPYTGDPITLTTTGDDAELVVKGGGNPLVAGKDYDVTYINNVEPGTATVIVALKGNYSGSTTTTFQIVKASPTADDISIAAVGKQTYTGADIKPTPEVKVWGKTLRVGTDFDYSYANNRNVGTSAKITVTLKGSYSGSKSANFEIVAKAVADKDISVAAVGDQAYTGSDIKPTPEVKVGGVTLKSGTDFDYSYSNNRNVGTAATIKVTLKGNYSGSKSVSFKIVAKAVAAKDINVAAVADQVYTGRDIRPTPAVKIGNVTLKSGTDFTYSYKNNRYEGTYAKGEFTGNATITVTLRGNYSGSKSVGFTIRLLTFPDVNPTSHWARRDVSLAKSLGLMNGYQNGNFGPDDSLTRGQVAVILWNLSGSPEAKAGAKNFPDVKASDYFYKAVRWASSVGVVNGYANGKFGPGDNVKREQLAAMIANYGKSIARLNGAGSASDYASAPDRAKVSSWATASVGWCYRNGVMPEHQGVNTIRPQNPATRAETAAMVVRLYFLINP